MRPRREWRAVVVMLAAAAVPARAQTVVPSPPVPLRSPQPDLPLPTLEALYGEARPEDLDHVALNGASYQRRNVLVRGQLAFLTGTYLALQQGTARVMLIPFNAGDHLDFSRFLGSEVEVKGIVRVLPARQKIERCLPEGAVPESKCEDPLLPILPDTRPDWPPVSITVLAMHEREGRRRGGGARPLADTGLEAAAADGKPVRALGQFRGANLCRDLGPETRRDVADWVLLTTDGPVWVTGRRPEGKGFRLDPAYRSDTGRWLEVTGKVERAGDVRYLKASKVALVARPADLEPHACPP